VVKEQGSSESRARLHQARRRAVKGVMAPGDLPRRRQTDDLPCSTRAASGHCGASAAFLQHRAANCAHLSLNHRQRPRRL
jgi:hypothetical protein